MIENITLADNISVETLVGNLSDFLKNCVKLPQLPFVSNIHKFKQAVDLGMLPRNPDYNYTLGDIFKAFEDPGCLALKLIFNYQGERLKVDYTLTLSSFSF